MKKKYFALLLVLMLAITSVTGCGSSGGSDAEVADTVIIGTIYTVDKDESTVSALAIKDGRYVYVGDEEGVQAFIGDTTEVVALEEGMVLPSFSDGHAHGHSGGVGYLYEVNLYEGTSIEEYVATVEQFIKDHPDLTFINGAGWINGYFPAGGPTAAMLDAIDTDLPITLVSGDHHSFWVNSKALELMGVDKNTPDVPGGVIERDAQGNPTGTFRELAQDLVGKIIPGYTVEQYKEGILAYQEEAASYGMTSYWEPMVNLNGDLNILQAYNELDEEGKLLIRVYGGYMVLDGPDALDQVDACKEAIDKSAGGDFEVNAIKLMVDGVVEGKTAYLLDDYADTPGFKGEALWTQDSLNKVFAKADSLGITLHTHAIGDAAVRMTIDACEYAFEQNGDTGNRHAITHLQVVDPADIKRMADLKMVASANAYWFCKEPGYFYELEVPYLGEARANKEYPMKSFFDSGIYVATASDFPVTIPAMPLAAIQTGVTRCDRYGDPETLQNPEERVSVAQMIASTTYNCAYQYFMEEEFGSIEVGKSADLVILDQNLFDINPVKIGEVTILRTFLKGDTVFAPE